MGEKKYILHLNIVFVHPIKPGRTPSYPLNSTHGDISVTDCQYQKNVYDYHLVKNMNSSINKIVIVAIYKQWIKGEKYIMMGYANNSFVKLMYCMYVRYGQITPGDLMQNQEEMQASYNVKDSIVIIFYHIKTGQ